MSEVKVAYAGWHDPSDIGNIDNANSIPNVKIRAPNEKILRQNPLQIPIVLALAIEGLDNGQHNLTVTCRPPYDYTDELTMYTRQFAAQSGEVKRLALKIALPICMVGDYHFPVLVDGQPLADVPLPIIWET